MDTANQCMSFSLPSPVLLLPGDYNLLLLDQLLKFPELKLIGCCNELNAGYVLVLLDMGGRVDIVVLSPSYWNRSCHAFHYLMSILIHLPKCSTPSLPPFSFRLFSSKLCRRWLRPQERCVGHGGDLHSGWLERGQRCGRGLLGRFALDFHQWGSQQQRPRLGPNLASYDW